ncbi:hypothetical protein A7U43_23445 [Mycobacterium adipatum]|uniref:Uncharacterized protein n=1 Tax=Mycobacterium adipatum TaxID=1682113 RepID=A0A172US81_9MYCO|nr:hypothetical protein [Mycobacterium adipatum]ANE81838.1 hypothetical protein A7U43_23445 [Mycobacterium adipatum]MBI5738610.1 hypothetical protein [Mycolicibacterium neoaurum]
MRLFQVLAVPVLIGAGLGAAPTPAATADCTSAGGTTICSQGEVRGSNTGDGPSGSSGPYVPYPCDYDWYACDDAWGWEIDVNLDPDLGRPGGPGGPDIGLPGGGRPNAGGGGGRGGRGR